MSQLTILGDITAIIGSAVVAPFASAENSALSTTLITFTVFFKASGLLAFASFLHLFMLHSQTEDLWLRDVFYLLFLLLKAMGVGVCVSGQSLDDGLLVPFFVIHVVAAVKAVALLAAEHLLLEAFAV